MACHAPADSVPDDAGVAPASVEDGAVSEAEED